MSPPKVQTLFTKAQKHWRTAFFSGVLHPVPSAPGKPRDVELISVTATGSTPMSDVTITSEVLPEGRIRFDLAVLSYGELDFSSIELSFDLTVDGHPVTLSLAQPEIDARMVRRPSEAKEKWREFLEDPGITRILDIGGRPRVGPSRKNAFPGKELLILDILDGPEVDIVGDVHEVSKITDEKFDAFLSIATFEHLIMPWKAAIEINRVLRPGGIGFVVTHQTVGVHERPWDFFRFSEWAWKGIFNVHTGFEIVAADMSQPAAILSNRWSQQTNEEHRSVGFRDSSVLVRKITEPLIDWDVSIGTITSDMYPH